MKTRKKNRQDNKNWHISKTNKQDKRARIITQEKWTRKYASKYASKYARRSQERWKYASRMFKQNVWTKCASNQRAWNEQAKQQFKLNKAQKATRPKRRCIKWGSKTSCWIEDQTPRVEKKIKNLALTWERETSGARNKWSKCKQNVDQFSMPYGGTSYWQKKEKKYWGSESHTKLRVRIPTEQRVRIPRWVRVRIPH